MRTTAIRGCAAWLLVAGAACGDVDAPRAAETGDAAPRAPQAAPRGTDSSGRETGRTTGDATADVPGSQAAPRSWERAAAVVATAPDHGAEVRAQAMQEDITGDAIDPAGLARLRAATDNWSELLTDEMQAAGVVEEMRAALIGTDFWRMRAALAVLQRSGHEPLAAELRSEISPLLRHAEGGTRVRAAKLIGSLGATQADVQAVIEQVRSRDVARRWIVARTLVAISGDRLHPDADLALAALLRDERPEVVDATIAALAASMPGPATSRAIVVLAADAGASAASIRRFAVLEHKDRALVEALLRVAQSDPADRAAAALGALQKGVQPEDRPLVAGGARAILSSRAQLNVRVNAVLVLASAAGAGAVAELRRLADDTTEPRELRAVAATAADAIESR